MALVTVALVALACVGPWHWATSSLMCPSRVLKRRICTWTSLAETLAPNDRTRPSRSIQSKPTLEATLEALKLEPNGRHSAHQSRCRKAAKTQGDGRVPSDTTLVAYGHFIDFKMGAQNKSVFFSWLWS
eukprot:s2971_g3.t1